jgi:hypothetical protein
MMENIKQSRTRQFGEHGNTVSIPSEDTALCRDSGDEVKDIIIVSSHFFTNHPKKTVTKTEILAALKTLTTEERLEIIETASRMMREEIEAKAQRKAEKKRQLRAAAEAAVPLYQSGGPLHDLWSPDSEPYFDSEEEYLSAGVKTNA